MVGLLGRGGMGEVYRADDLKVGQPVALKFLPAEVERDPDRLEIFLTEVRLSLRVTHPNVCRVFDIGQIDDRHFLSMEFVDGEDLASLLRRIGRLPEDKAVEIARQLCAGLSAAHEEGVLHRDLKPSNIMIDGRGRAKITDFGLAGATEGISGRDAKVGTPQYMAPEQVSGGSLTERTDIFTLGLVLYEVFTGKRAFEIKTLDDLQKLSATTPTSPSSYVSGLNPLVERAILRCLEPDPAKRPPSAAALAAALPGGDPLAMAIAAGDTPSPEMVAAAGSDAGLSPAVAWSLLAIAFVGIAAAALMVGRISLNTAAAPERPPAVLVERSRDLLRSVGFPAASIVDSAWGFELEAGFPIRPVDARAREGFATQAGHALSFWYREAPVLLERYAFTSPYFLGDVWPFDPQMRYSGEVMVRLDRDGHLRHLQYLPPQLSGGPSTPTNWDVLFKAAGFDLSRWQTDSPKWTPMHFGDERIAWVPATDQSGPAIRIEGTSFRGLPVQFVVIYPWSAATRDLGTRRSPQQRAADLAGILLISGLMLTAVFVARRNLRLDRADRRGAIRLAIVAMAIVLGCRLLDEHHVPSIWQLYLMMMAAGFTLLMGLLVAAFYLALEPFVRRIWPAVIISWSRALAGSITDRLVARDVLIGCAVSGLVCVVGLSGEFATGAVTGVLPLFEASPAPLQGLNHAVATIVMGVVGSVTVTLMSLLMLLGLRKLLRREWAAVLASALILAALGSAASSAPLVTLPFQLVAQSILFLLLARVGLVAGVAAAYVQNIIMAFPVAWPPTAWYSKVGLLGVAVAAALAIVAFKLSTAPARTGLTRRPDPGVSP